MLRVFVYLSGGPEHVEIKACPAGHSLAALKEGRKAHFWWTADEVDKDPGTAAILRSLVPNADRVWVGRDFGNGMQAMFDGMMVEGGCDPTMVSLTALEPVRQQPYPQVGLSGAVREPLRPVAAPAQEAPSAPVAAPAHGTASGALFQSRPLDVVNAAGLRSL